MARFLHHLARTCHHHRLLVVAVWIAIVGGLAFGAATLSKPTDDAFSIPGVESQQANDLLAERFPEVPTDGAEARIVYQSTESLSSGEQKAAVSQAVEDLAEVEGVISVSDPYTSDTVSDDGRVALVTASFAEPSGDLSDAQHDALVEAASSPESTGVDVAIGGNAAPEAEHGSSSEAIGFLVGFVVLALTFGSLVAAGLPLITALVGVGSGLTGLSMISHWTTLSSTAPVLALMLGIAVGIDYALFILSRYRTELLAGHEPREAAGRAAGTAGSAVVFAGLTVIIALAGLAVVGIPFLTVMGLAAAATVAIAVLVALTLLPALLSLTGRAVLRFRVPMVRRPDTDENRPGAPITWGERWGRLVTRRRGVALTVSVLTLLVLAIPLFGMRTGLPTDAAAPKDSDARIAYDVVSDTFGAGTNGPLSVVVTGDGVADGAADDVAAKIKGLEDVAAVADPVINRAGDTAIVPVTPQSGPTSEATSDLVQAIRDTAPDLEATGEVDLYVTGSTAVAIDVSDQLNQALPVYLLVVVGLALILLMIAFRSVLVPVKAALGFLLTVGATLGTLVAVFQWGWLASLLGLAGTAPIVSFIPILVIAILFGLAMDYEVFLVSRIHEEHTRGASPQEAIVGGLRKGARVVTAAAIIMIAVFAGFILRDDVTVQSIGFALALGVLIDAFVVRMTIVPAALSMLGHRAWTLPRWLDRLLPNVDIEGHSLDQDTRSETQVAETTPASPDKAGSQPGSTH